LLAGSILSQAPFTGDGVEPATLGISVLESANGAVAAKAVQTRREVWCLANDAALVRFVILMGLGVAQNRRARRRPNTAGLRRTEADMKSNLPLRVDQNRCKVRQNSQHLLVCNRQARPI
jgi:hypothetical protein